MDDRGLVGGVLDGFFIGGGGVSFPSLSGVAVSDSLSSVDRDGNNSSFLALEENRERGY